MFVTTGWKRAASFVNLAAMDARLQEDKSSERNLADLRGQTLHRIFRIKDAPLR